MDTRWRQGAVLLVVMAGAIWVGLTARQRWHKPYRADGPTVQALSNFAQQGPQGATAKLSAMTPFAWDRAYFFEEGTQLQAISKTVGADLFASASGRLDERGPLLVFTRADQVVEAVLVIPPLFVSGPGLTILLPSSTVKAHSQGRPHLLLLQQP